MMLPIASAVAVPDPTLTDLLDFPSQPSIVADAASDRVAWIEVRRGVRSIWTMDADDSQPRLLFSSRADDGLELTQLVFDDHRNRLLFVRGGDHDANWPAEGDRAPNPAGQSSQPGVEVWTVPLSGGVATKLTEGDAPAVSSTGVVVFTRKGEIWTLSGGEGISPQLAFPDAGKDRALAWSPDGTKLAFVSDHGDHSYVGVYQSSTRQVQWLAPSTNSDSDPVWSPDGANIAFIRQPGAGGPPPPLVTPTPKPFSVVRVRIDNGRATSLWSSPDTLDGSYPQDGDGIVLRWPVADTLSFIGTMDGWEHLYALSATGGTPRLLTPGAFMVEHVSVGRGGGTLLYAANTGGFKADDQRRHIYRIALKGGSAVPLTAGEGIEWSPVETGGGRLFFLAAGARRPPALATPGKAGIRFWPVAASNYPSSALVPPIAVTLTAPDGTPIQGQLFRPSGRKNRAGIVFVHGGPERQMLLGWHYRAYYANAYAVNQYLAMQGFTVLSVNYRLGVGSGRAFEQPVGAGPEGASEYQDVFSAARYLQALPEVDPKRIGIWGGSYGGYLTALALARNSDVFKAGVDFHGVHDWSRYIAQMNVLPRLGYEQGDWAKALEQAFAASPVASIDRWKSPILLIHGDDDRNVRFDQTVDLAARLRRAGVPFEERVFVGENHDMLRYADWLAADEATADFFIRRLGR